MNLGEMLTALRGELADNVGTIISGQTPTDTLWTDTQLTNYLNWALNRFIARTGMIRDAVSAVSQITLSTTAPQPVSNAQLYAIDPSITRIMSIRPNGAPDALWDLNYVEIDPSANPDLAGVELFQPFEVNYPRAFAPDFTSGQILVYPAYTGYWPWTQPNGQPYAPILNMRVMRLPLRQLNPLILTATPEIPVQYHMDIVTGAAFRALNVADVDASAPGNAATFERLFKEAIQDARRDVRKKTRTTPKFVVGETGAW